MNTLSTAQSSLPDRFGKYAVLRHLASGGMADLFLARATGIVGFEKIVVIKRIREDLVDDVEITELFLHEARLAATLEHPHIAQVYDVGTVNDSYFFAMEYVHGMDLRKIMRAAINKQRSIPLADAVQIGIGVCAALHYAHERRDSRGNRLGIIHRDVSPSNVLVSYDGAVKVCDFGVAKATNRTHQTAHGVLKGKISYMSPEQCGSRPIDRRSDIYAIAIVLYELTTLNKLYRGANDLDIIKQVTHGEVLPPSQLRRDYPRELERIILKALSKDPDQRYATAQEMQLDLEAFARDQKLALSSVSLERLMTELFDGHVEAWQEALREGKDLVDHILERPPSNPSSTPTPDPTPEPQTVDALPFADVEIAISSSSPRSQSRVMASKAWPLAALALGFVGLSFIAGGLGNSDSEVATLAQAEAEKLATVLDTESRGLHLRADGFATMPMLRAAIGTDAGTLRDMATSEFVFTPNRNEVLELFQLGSDGRTQSLLRVPMNAAAIPALKGRDTRLAVSGGRLVLSASALVSPLYHARSVAGSIVIAADIDVSGPARRLALVAQSAALRGPGGIVRLVDGAATDAPVISVPLPASQELGPTELTLDVVPRATRQEWRARARYGCWLLAGFLIALFVYRLRRRSAR